MSNFYIVADCRPCDLAGVVAGDVVPVVRLLGYEWVSTSAISSALSMGEGFSAGGGTFGVFEVAGRGGRLRRCLAVYRAGVLVSGLIGSICLALTQVDRLDDISKDGEVL